MNGLFGLFIILNNNIRMYNLGWVFICNIFSNETIVFIISLWEKAVWQLYSTLTQWSEINPAALGKPDSESTKPTTPNQQLISHISAVKK